jgi:hypothetical protein
MLQTHSFHDRLKSIPAASVQLCGVTAESAMHSVTMQASKQQSEPTVEMNRFIMVWLMRSGKKSDKSDDAESCLVTNVPSTVSDE